IEVVKEYLDHRSTLKTRIEVSWCQCWKCTSDGVSPCIPSFQRPQLGDGENQVALALFDISWFDGFEVTSRT
ncbi:hypothetical protein HAX54_019819, partial [Datura stramonium]|nr:hypothetical protein [Datura stramonium]